MAVSGAGEYASSSLEPRLSSSFSSKFFVLQATKSWMRAWVRGYANRHIKLVALLCGHAMQQFCQSFRLDLPPGSSTSSAAAGIKIISQTCAREECGSPGLTNLLAEVYAAEPEMSALLQADSETPSAVMPEGTIEV